MTTDNQEIVPEEQVSTTEPVSTEEVPKEPPALTEERVQQLIAEATMKAVGQAKEAGRRELQGQQDRNRAEVESANRRAKFAEDTLKTTRTRLSESDPDTAKEMELEEYRAREKGRQTQEQVEAQQRQQVEFHSQFQSNLTQFITSLGVDPKDGRIDWGDDAPNYLEAQRRVLESATKIQKENIQTEKEGLEKRLKDLEAKVNEEANSVETTSGGVVAGSDTEFIKKFASGELPYTKGNKARYEKIQNTYE